MIKLQYPNYPFKSHWFLQGKHRQHYLDEGTGDPVIMLHGNPSWSFYYRHLVMALRDSHRCIVPDHIGMGLSDKPSDVDYDYHLQQRVDDLDALLTSLGDLQNVTLIVHDWGGMIGFAWALRHPEKIKRLVILNTAAFPLPAEKPLPLPLRLVRNTKFGAFLVNYFNAFAAGAAWMGVKTPMKKADRIAMTAPYNNKANRIATLRFVQDIPLSEADRGFDLVQKTGESLTQFANLPTLICWGMQDFVFDHHFLKQFKAALPDAQVHEFANAGHYVLEDGRAEIVPLVRQFLGLEKPV